MAFAEPDAETVRVETDVEQVLTGRQVSPEWVEVHELTITSSTENDQRYVVEVEDSVLKWKSDRMVTALYVPFGEKRDQFADELDVGLIDVEWSTVFQSNSLLVLEIHYSVN